MTAVLPPVPYFGGKITAAPRIVSLLPSHQHYVEPYAGSLAVLLAKPRSKVETVNDLDGALVTFWRVLRERPQELARVCALTPHARTEQHAAYQVAGLPELEVARRIFVQLTQGRGATRRRAGWRHIVDPVTTGSALPDYLDAYVGRIAAAAERLAGVSLDCLPALDLIAKYGRASEVLLYVDPPYLGSTRGRPGRADYGQYACDMPHEPEHRALAAALHGCVATVVLSGYPSDLYDDELYADWHRVEFGASTGQGGTWEDRTEVLWSNQPLGREGQLPFDGEPP